MTRDLHERRGAAEELTVSLPSLPSHAGEKRGRMKPSTSTNSFSGITEENTPLPLDTPLSSNSSLHIDVALILAQGSRQQSGGHHHKYYYYNNAGGIPAGSRHRRQPSEFLSDVFVNTLKAGLDVVKHRRPQSPKKSWKKRSLFSSFQWKRRTAVDDGGEGLVTLFIHPDPNSYGNYLLCWCQPGQTQLEPDPKFCFPLRCVRRVSVSKPHENCSSDSTNTNTSTTTTTRESSTGTYSGTGTNTVTAASSPRGCDVLELSNSRWTCTGMLCQPTSAIQAPPPPVLTITVECCTTEDNASCMRGNLSGNASCSCNGRQLVISVDGDGLQTLLLDGLEQVVKYNTRHAHSHGHQVPPSS